MICPEFAIFSVAEPHRGSGTPRCLANGGGA